MSLLCLTWSPTGSRRIHDIRKLLSADVWNYSIFYKRKTLSIIKYPVQAINTFVTLIKKRPTIVVVQNPPIFAALTCLVYGQLYNAKIVIDYHLIWSMSGFIKNSVIKTFIKVLEEFCAKKAYLNLTYADDWENILVRMGAKKTLTLYDFVDTTWTDNADLTIRNRFSKHKNIIVMACGTGHVLERPDILIKACRNIKDVVIVVTGNPKYLKSHIDETPEQKVDNFVFPGFLPDLKYRGLIATCDFVANISYEPYGIPHTITEAFASGRPVIVSKNPALVKLLGRDYPLFLVDNELETVKETVCFALQKKHELTKEVNSRYQRLMKKRNLQLKKLLSSLNED